VGNISLIYILVNTFVLNMVLHGMRKRYLMKVELTYDADDILKLCREDAEANYPNRIVRLWVDSEENPSVKVEVYGK
jgi:hypothetical protein